MPAWSDDVRLRGKTGSGRTPFKTTRLTRNGSQAPIQKGSNLIWSSSKVIGLGTNPYEAPRFHNAFGWHGGGFAAWDPSAAVSHAGDRVLEREIVCERQADV